MQLQTEAYELLAAPALCADPFIQEWIFYPTSEVSLFFNDLVASDQIFSLHANIVRHELLSGAGISFLSIHAIDGYVLMKQELVAEHRTERRYGIADRALSLICKLAIEFNFETVEQEIYFYKIVRPLFGQETEYLRLRYHAELFGVDDDFFRRQPDKLERLREREVKLLNAYVTGDDGRRDEYWYRCADESGSTRGSEVVSQYLGMKRYLHFLTGFWKL